MRHESTLECTRRGHRELSTIWRSLSSDIWRYLNKSPENQAAGDSFKTRLSAFFMPQILCLLLFRIAHYLWANRWDTAARLVARFNYVIHKVHISPQSCIGPGCFLPHPAGVTFHGRAGRGLTLYARCVCVPREPLIDSPVETGPAFGDRVTVGGHAVVVGPIAVGDDTLVAPGAHLLRDAPKGVLVVTHAMRHGVHVPRGGSEKAIPST